MFEFVRPQDGALIVVASGHDNAEDFTYVSVSGDGGTTFSAPAPVGRGLFEVTAAALSADGTAIETLAQVPSIIYQRVPVAGATEARTSTCAPEPSGRDTDFGFPRIVTRPDGRPMIVAGRRRPAPATGCCGPAPTRSRTRAGPPGRPPPGSRGSARSPPPARTASGRSRRPRSSTASASCCSACAEASSCGRDRWGPRWTGRQSNDLGQRLVGSGRDFTEDAGGRLHAAWSRYEVCGAKRQCLLYRRNEPRSFGPPVVYPLPLAAAAPSDLQLAPNAGGSGWLVWRGGVGTGAPNLATPLVTPPRGSRVGSKRVARGPRVTLPTRYGCVAPGGVYHARMLVRGRRHGVRITSVRFSFDGGKAPRRPTGARPTAHTFRLPFAAGERHVAEARVTYRRGGRTGHTQVGRAIVMCP